METFKSDISGKEFAVAEKIPGRSVPAELLKLIQSKNSGFTIEHNLSMGELNMFRSQYMADFLLKEVKDLTVLEQTVLNSLTERAALSSTIMDVEDQQPGTGQRIADHVATFGGSWTFILSFIAILLIWISVNAWYLHNRGFDPYPFILLNLLLSCLAALQAPVIMMSQNRQEEKDRQRAKKDYMINLKSELEIRMLHEKLDHLIIRQQEDIIEVQRLQVEQMDNIVKNMNATR